MNAWCSLSESRLPSCKKRAVPAPKKNEKSASINFVKITKSFVFSFIRIKSVGIMIKTLIH